MKLFLVQGLLLASFAFAQPPAESPVDWDKARELLRRAQRGDTLDADERAYLEPARAERRQQRQQGPVDQRRQRQAPERLIPLTDMAADDRYEGEDGGLYGGGANRPPDAHRRAAEAALATIAPPPTPAPEAR